MGAWGSRSFENDAALDWAGVVEDHEHLTPVAEALDRVAAADDEYLEVDEASHVIAAAEVLAALLDHPAPDLPASLSDWIAARRTAGDAARPDLLNLAQRALARVTTNSELKELWDEAADRQAWYDAVADLQARLQP